MKTSLIHMLDVKALEVVRNIANARLEKTEDFKESLRLSRTIYGLDNKIIQSMKKGLV